jgi:cytoskeletal protein CcmA (bactofilin family)
MSEKLLAVLLAVVVVVGFVPGVAAAQPSGTERVGGLVEVAEGETHAGDLSAVGGTILIAGTVTGDVEATGGSIVVAATGVVDGDLSAIGGSVLVEGTVGGDAAVSAGSILVREGASVGGTLEAAAGSVRMDGQVAGDARLAGETVTVGPTAAIGGDLLYDAGTAAIAPDASVAGAVRAEAGVVDVGPEVAPPAIPRGVGAVYGLLANLVLGAALLVVVPRFTGAVTGVGTREALRSGGVGFLALVGVPIALVLVAVTIVGIPLSLAGLVAFALLLWVAFVYGSLVAGTWLLSLLDREGRWLALVSGLVAVALVGLVPFVGGVVRFLVLLVGLGAFVLAVRGVRSDDEGGFVVGAAEDESAAV